MTEPGLRQDGGAGIETRRRSWDQDKTAELKQDDGAGTRQQQLGVSVSPLAICRSALRCRSRQFAAWRLGVALGDLPLGVLVLPLAIRRSASWCRPRQFAARRLGLVLGDLASWSCPRQFTARRLGVALGILSSCLTSEFSQGMA